MNSTADKKNFFYIVVLVLTFIAIIVGAAFAIYTFLHKQKEGSTSVYTGTLQIEYLSGERIEATGLYPIYKPTYDTTENVYKNKFKITNTGNLDGILSLTLEINRNDFTGDIVKYKLFNSNKEELATGDIVGTDPMELDKNIIIKGNEAVEYTLMIWLEENGQDQSSEMRRTLTGELEANAVQKTN